LGRVRDAVRRGCRGMTNRILLPAGRMLARGAVLKWVGVTHVGFEVTAAEELVLPFSGRFWCRRGWCSHDWYRHSSRRRGRPRHDRCRRVWCRHVWQLGLIFVCGVVGGELSTLQYRLTGRAKIYGCSAQWMVMREWLNQTGF
jgi:hypothetical protein